MNAKDWNRKEYHELVALYLMEAFFGDKTKNFQKGESPDWQNSVDDIGMEVTTAITPEEGRRHAFEQRIVEDHKTYQQACELDKKEFGGTYHKNIKPVDGEYTYNLVSVRDGDGFENLMISIHNKLMKLNNNPNFKEFSTNYLYIRDLVSCINENMIEERIIPKVKKLHAYYPKKFLKYFIFNRDSCMFYMIDVSEKSYKKMILTEKFYAQIKEQARKQKYHHQGSSIKFSEN